MPAYSPQEIYNLVVSAAPGKSAAWYQTMTAIAMAESGGRTDAINRANRNGTFDSGLFQINSVHGYNPTQLIEDPVYNIQAAVKIFGSQGFNAWSVYKTGRYKQFMGQTAGLKAASPSKAPRAAVPGKKNVAFFDKSSLPDLTVPTFDTVDITGVPDLSRRKAVRMGLKAPDTFGPDGRGVATLTRPASAADVATTPGLVVEDFGVENPQGFGVSAFEPNTLTIPSVDEAVASLGKITDRYAEVYGQSQTTETDLTTTLGSGGPKAANSGPMASGTGLVGDILNAAKGLLGKPYVWGGTTANGVDCSGLIYYAFNAAGFKISRYRAVDYGTKVGRSVSLNDARPGDIVYWDNPGDVDHVGIYLGSGQYIQAPTTGDVVKISSLSNRPPTSIRRILPDSAWS